MLNEALKGCPAGDEQVRFGFVFAFSELLTLRGELDEALRIYREEVLPVYERLGDVRPRAGGWPWSRLRP